MVAGGGGGIPVASADRCGRSGGGNGIDVFAHLRFSTLV